MAFYIFKIIHIVGFVSWMAGLFYLGRIFVYHREALDINPPDRDILTRHSERMEHRVYRIILGPAMMITWLFGLLMIWERGYEYFAANKWLHYKIGFVLLLTIYHLYSKKVMQGLANGVLIMSSLAFRLFNEVPTVLLIVISSMAVLKNMVNPMILLISVIGIIALLIMFTLFYKRLREKGKAI